MLSRHNKQLYLIQQLTRSNEVRNSHRNVQTWAHPSLTGLKWLQRLQTQPQHQAGWMRPEERVTHGDSWKEQSLFCSVMLWSGITGTSPQSAWRRQQSRGGRGRTATQGQRIEGSIHPLHQFGVLGGWLCCLSLFVFLSLSAWGESRNQLMSALTQWPQVLCVPEAAKTKQKRNNNGERKMEDTSFRESQLALSLVFLPCHWCYMPRTQTFRWRAPEE